VRAKLEPQAAQQAGPPDAQQAARIVAAFDHALVAAHQGVEVLNQPAQVSSG
jgi:hypothetical protein